jgi:hypothetical protein
MDEPHIKGFCYNCDEKYFLVKKCNEQKDFMGISEDVTEEDATIPLVEEPSLTDATQDLTEPPEFDPTIYLHALTRFSTSQAFNLIGYTKHQKVIILVESGSTHNFLIITLPRKPISIFLSSIIFKS